MDLNKIARTGFSAAYKAADTGLKLLLGAVERVRAARSDGPVGRPEPAPAARTSEKTTSKSGRFARAEPTPAPQVDGASGHGGRPASVDAENTPSKLAAEGKGREPAPLGSEEPPGS